MRIISLHLSQFRSYGALDLLLGADDVQLFVGENASGKTNLLEAVSMLSTLQSFRGADEEDLRAWGTDFYRIVAEVHSDSGERTRLEAVCQVTPRKKKAFFRNDVRVSSASMLGALPTVAFLPQDLELFSGPPSLRRRFLDQLLSQTSPAYYKSLVEYQSLLKQRNALLKRIADRAAKPQELDPWDQEIASQGSRITIARLEIMETFGLALREELAALGQDGWRDVRIHYERAGSERTPDALTAQLRGLLTHYRERDMLLQATSVGPHRDDWSVVLDGRHLLSFASRGQQRVCVLALLLLEASFLDIRRGERPVILLDDIFSELDERHQQRVLHSLRQNQVLCTATHMLSGASPVQCWSVQAGAVTQR